MLWMVLEGLAVGAAAGTVFFVGLWLTTRRLPASDHPALLALGSLMARMAVVIGAFLLLSRHRRWEALVAGLAGLVVARIVTVRRVKAAGGEE